MGLHLAEVDHKVVAFVALDNAVDETSHAGLVFVKQYVSLGLADLLAEALLDRLSCNASQLRELELIDLFIVLDGDLSALAVDGYD